jgi:hypothetical protein
MEIPSDYISSWKKQLQLTRSEAMHKMAALSHHFNKTEILTILGSEYGAEWQPMLKIWWDSLTSEPEDDGNALEVRRALRNLYNSMYQKKAEEITGRSTRPDGKPIHPKWGAKENNLLKQDFEHYGEHTLRQLFVLFFRDAVPAVRKFTMDKGAGYTYPVFHGSIAKLEMSGKNGETCPHCGKLQGHEDWCPIIEEMRQRDRQWKEEVLEEQENYEGPDITELFKEKLKGGKGQVVRKAEADPQ